MSATPASMREAYLLAVGQLAMIDRKLTDLRIEQRNLEERAEKCRVIRDGFKDAACSACDGYGYIRVFYAQDDVKAEMCEQCKGTGLPVASPDSGH